MTDNGSTPVDQVLAEAAAAVEARTSPRVLVIDDEPCVAALLQEVLEDEGYAVICRAMPPSSSEIAALAPAVIVTELVFHGWQDGHVAQWDLDTLLRSPVPAIVCSVAVRRLETIADDLAAHGHAALAKPFSVDALLALVAVRAGGPVRQAQQPQAD